MKNGKIDRYDAHCDKMRSICWSSASGRRLATGSIDHSTSVFALTSSGSLTRESFWKVNNDSIDQVKWCPLNDHVFASASVDRTIKLFDCRMKDNPVNDLYTQGENINLAWHPDGSCLGTATKDNLITFVDCRQFKPITEHHFRHEVNEFAWYNTGNLFFVTTGYGSVQIFYWKGSSLQNCYEINVSVANCICITFDPVNGSKFAVGSADALVTIWTFKELICLRTLTRLEWAVRCVGFNSDGSLIASASEDHFIDVAYVESGDQMAAIDSGSSVFSIAWHPYKHILAYTCDERLNTSTNFIKLWNYE